MAVRPHENHEQDAEASAGEKEEEDTAEEGVVAKSRRTEILPSAREIEEHNIDRGVFRQWSPRCFRGRGEACPHKSVKDKEEEIQPSESNARAPGPR